MAEPAAHTEVPAESHAQPAAFGVVTAPVVVALAIFLVILFLIWKKVPAAIGRSLDKKIAAIREQLDEAESLRKDAEALKAEYEAKAVAADKEAAAMVERARHEAEAIVAKAAEDAAALVERRKAMAEAKIAAEERAAIDELRATTAKAATEAAAKLIAERGDAGADKKLVDQAIAGLAKR
ncbi:MAG TPA: F0F1 ATP synthase subunit B [Sphingomicrobium sp.]|nr:F0F1 ATP synthase subunit B [Sphingomicrobium sp.]